MADPFLDALSSVRGRPPADDPFLTALSEVRGPSVSQRVVRTGLRVGGAIAGGVVGGLAGGPTIVGIPAGVLVGGAAGAGLGELGAEWLEEQPGRGQVRSSINPWQVATQTALGAIPVPGAGPGVGVLRAAVGQGAKGAILGGTANVATSLAEGQAPTARGVAESAALGTLIGGGVGAAVRPRTLRPTQTPPIAPRGFLRAGPAYSAPERGPAAKFGDTIPMQHAPDGSYVRSVPGEYARHEVRGLLPAGPRFVAGETGPAATLEQAAARGAAAGADDAFTTALQNVRASQSSVRSVPAAPLTYEFKGRTLQPSQYSGDVHATPAPKVDLTPDLNRELRRMAEEMENLPFTARTWNWLESGGKTGNAAGGEADVVAGSAGARVYRDIVGDVSGAGRRDVLTAIQNLLRGKRTPTGDLALDVARRRLAGELSGELPPDAGDFYRLPGEEAQSVTRGGGPAQANEGFDRFAADVDDAAAGGFRRVGRDPGEEGAIAPVLATRLAASGGGAAMGATLPDEDATLEDRLLGAIAGAGAGYAGARLLTRSAGTRGGTPLPPGRGHILTTSAASRQPIPPPGQIPAQRLITNPRLTDDVQDAADAILEQHGGFVRQRRGVQSVARTEGLADRVEVRADRPLTPGTAANAERLRAYQNTTATILQKRQQAEQSVRELEQAVQQGRASDVQRLALPTRQLELERLKTESEVLTASLRGLTSEAGRALHILRYQARILASGDQQAIAEAAQASQRGLKGTAQGYFYANILSGIQTHERNVLGNLSNAIYNLAAHPFAVGADVIRSSVTGQARQVFLGELPERVAGTVVALPRAFSNALRSLRTGVAAADVSSFDRPAIREFRGGGANPFNYPKRALESVDDFFSTIAAEQTLYGAAFAQAKREGVTGEAFVRRVADLKVNPSDEIVREVESNRARLLFREKPGRLADAILAAKRHLPALGYVVPFVKIPANIIRQGFEASPAGFAMKSARQGGRAGADAMGRAAMGSLALAPLAYYAALGKITGDAPRDPAQRAAFYESGKRPHSIQFGETWYSYQPIQPLNVPLSLVANAYQVWNETKGDPDANAEDIALSVLGRMGSSLLDQSFLSGVSALVDALGDPERYFQRFAQQLATGFVPFSSAMRMTAQATDPYVRAPQGVAEGVQAIIPGASQSLPPRLTRFGEPVERVEGALNVFKPSPVVTDPIAAELERLDITLRPAAGPKALSATRGVRVPLSRELQHTTGQVSGRAMRQSLETVTASPTYQRANDFVRQRMLERAIADARGAVNEQAARAALIERMTGVQRGVGR